MFCPECGKKLEDDSKFCEHCGNRIESEIKEVTPINKDEPISNSETHQNQPSIEPSVKKSNLWKWIVGGIIVSISIGPWFYILYRSMDYGSVGSKSDNPTSFVVTKQSKEDYESQEICSKQSKKFFQNKYGNRTTSNGNRQGFSIYKCHYNKNMNKCFILITTTETMGNITWKYKSIFDIKENQEIGNCNFSKGSWVMCKVSGKVCNSEEWDSLVKPYMTE